MSICNENHCHSSLPTAAPVVRELGRSTNHEHRHIEDTGFRYCGHCDCYYGLLRVLGWPRSQRFVVLRKHKIVHLRWNDIRGISSFGPQLSSIANHQTHSFNCFWSLRRVVGSFWICNECIGRLHRRMLMCLPGDYISGTSNI